MKDCFSASPGRSFGGILSMSLDEIVFSTGNKVHILQSHPSLFPLPYPPYNVEANNDRDRNYIHQASFGRQIAADGGKP